MENHPINEFEFGTEILNQGAYVRYPHNDPEVPPIFMTTAFNVPDLDALEERFAQKGFCYNRSRNPNRSTLIDLMTYLEHGEDSVCCSSGMGAISTALIALSKAGDHILANKVLYGESTEVFTDILSKYGVETTFVDFTDEVAVCAAVRENTVVLYTETVTNPVIEVPDLKVISEIAHAHGAKLVVDNTFMTGALVRPLDLGADLVVNSLTKFANGHSDAVCGAITGSAELIRKAYHVQVLLGSQADPFTSWLTQRGIRTLDLRIRRQSENAAALAAALSKSPYVKKVHHPSLPDHPQHEIAHREFGDYYGGMVTIELEDDREKLNTFMRALHFVHYAMTLGGYRTSLAYPPLGSHYGFPKEERMKLGISDGMMRISCGIEDTDDLVKDFLNALEVAYGA